MKDYKSQPGPRLCCLGTNPTHGPPTGLSASEEAGLTLSAEKELEVRNRKSYGSACCSGSVVPSPFKDGPTGSLQPEASTRWLRVAGHV